MLAKTYDAIVVLQVLEHLHKPEDALKRLLSHLSDGGMVIGGSPTMPSALAAFYRLWLQRKYRDRKVTEHRHISIIAPRRIRYFARQNGLSIALLTGAFFCRWTGSILEDFEWWVRTNLAWGATFPARGGELYFALQKSNIAERRGHEAFAAQIEM